MYQSFLFIHSWLRWIILILMIIVIVKSFIGMTNKSTYSKQDGTLTSSMAWSLRIQFVIGLVLYVFLSPITEAAFADFGGAMKEASLRYWAVEHIFAMFVGLGLAEVGQSKARKASSDLKKFKAQAIFFTLSLLIMLSRIPFTDSDRLFR